MESGGRRRIRAVYRDGVLHPLEDPGLPEGSIATIEILGYQQPASTGEEKSAGSRLVEEAGLPGELAESLEELIEHMAKQLAQRITGDQRLHELYAAVEALEPGAAPARIGPPPLDNDTWLLLLSDVLTVLEKAGYFDETRPIRMAANTRTLQPYTYVHDTLRGKPAYQDLARATGADEQVAKLVLETLAEAVKRAVKYSLQHQRETR